MKLRTITAIICAACLLPVIAGAIGISARAGGKRVTVSVDGAWQGTYAAGTTYAIGDIVTDGTTNYRSLQAGNVGHTPASSPTYWQAVLAKGDTGPTGATGSQGPTGAAGADGRTVLTTSGAPSAGTGTNGDYAYDPATYLMYGPKSGGAWPNGVLLKGADGAGFTGGSDGTYGWLTDSNTSSYTECVTGRYGLNFIGGEARMCKNGSNDLFLGLPAQTGNSGKYLTTNGTTASWGTIAAGSGIAISTAIPTETGTANLNDSTHVLTVASSTGYTQFTGSFTAWDTTPDAFAFTDETDVAADGGQSCGAAITVGGTNYPTTISATGDTGFGYKINGGTFTSASGTYAPNDTVAPCVNRSSSPSTTTTATVTIGGVSDTYSVTTAAGGASYDVGFVFWPASDTATIGSGETYVLATDTSPTTRGGATFQLMQTPFDMRTNDTQSDRRLKGKLLATASTTFRLTLPSSGTYKIWLAAGDDAADRRQQIDIYDDTTIKSSILTADTSGLAFYYTGADGTVYSSSATWISASSYGGSPITITTASTTLNFTLNAGATGATTLNYIRVQKQ